MLDHCDIKCYYPRYDTGSRYESATECIISGGSGAVYFKTKDGTEVAISNAACELTKVEKPKGD